MLFEGVIATLELEDVNEEDDVMLITNTGIIIRTRISEISVIGRTAAGVRVMRTGEDVLITNFTVVEKQEQAEEAISGETAETTDVAAETQE